MATDKLVHLHGHSEKSLLDGMTRHNELVDYTLQIGQPASCITDHGNLYSIVDHFQYAESKGQKPIAGFEAYVVNDYKFKDKSEADSETETKREHMVLLATNNDGYKRITKMCSVGMTDGFYYRPRIDDKLIAEIGTGGVIGMSACLAGRIAQNLLKDRIEEAEKWAVFYHNLFKGNFYLEIQPTMEKDQVKVNKGIIELHKKLGLPIVATSDYHYLRAEDSETHDVLLAMQSRRLVNDPQRWRFPGNTFYVMTREQMTEAFRSNGHEVLDQNVIQLAMDTTVEIAEKCNVSFNWGSHVLPKIEPPADNVEFNSWASKRQTDGSPSSDYLRYLCIKGLKEKGLITKEYRDRLDFELKVINDMGFPDYFLIFWDIMKFCRENDVPVGPARGSGGGSLVAYACGITGIDPIPYGLIFERFLNPERGKLPDIDSDFCVKKGWMVFDYLIKKYGKEHCCNIATFGRLQVKAVIKDIAKALGVPFEEVNEITKGIPKDIKHITELKELPEFDPFFKKYPAILKHALKLEGSPRHVSQHPAGICITPVAITDLLPVQNAKETEEGVEPGFLSQFEKDQTEQCGAVKLDILKLKNVTEIREQLHIINKLYGLKLTEQDIPFDDQKTWDTIGRGDTLGIFQMASNVAIPVLKKVRPQNIEELSAVNAFIRPGASGLEEYLEGKQDTSKIRQLDPRLDRHLAMTYGAIVYQEQIMFLISELLGISFGQADLYRRALEKPDKGKNVQIVAEFNEKAVTVGVERGFKKEVCELVRDLIVLNSGYGFNKSHSVAYAIISYWTAWIKTNYPLVFYTTMFNGNLEALPEFMEEAKKNGITIKPPHVSYSKYDSIIEDEPNRVIRIGLNAVKGIGPAAVESIMASQPYKSIDDFFDRNNLRAVNKKVNEAVIRVGAFEGLGINVEASDVENYLGNQLPISEIDDGQKVALLNRTQLWHWYEKVNEINAVKSISSYAIPVIMIKGKYFDNYQLEIEKGENVVVVPEDKLSMLGLKLEDIEMYKTRKRPKGFLKSATSEDVLKKIPVFRRSLIMNVQELNNIQEAYLDIYLKEVEEFGYSFLSHPLEKHLDKINAYDSVEDGYMMVTAGIVTSLVERKTKTGSKYYWLTLQTPREKVRVTLWDKQYKQYAQIVQKHTLLVAKGTKGFGGMNCELLKVINIKN